MKHLLLALTFIAFSSFAQLNMTQLGYLDIPAVHNTKLNDVWGYVDEFGNEFALVGCEEGLSIVNVTDPANPVEYSWIDGIYSVWRDIKVYQDYAYITTEAHEGLLIVDLSGLPGSPVTPFTHYDGPLGNEWQSAHNIYEDNGYVYIFGANRGNGGVIILDVATDPWNPIEVGTFDTWYVHDGYVVDDTGYFAHINDGFFSVVDLTDKANPVLLGTSNSPGNFTHNIWASTDANYVFTTDEISGGFVGAYDVTDPANIKYLDKIQSSSGDGIIPHNTHVRNNYIITSYYTDGIVVHDVTYPHNMVEIGNFDTSPYDSQTYNGCWGAFPFFPSGNILASDREEGLFILSVDYHQGAYLEGTVTEFGTGTPLNGVEISIDNQNIHDQSNIFGDYATGVESSGTYDVTYFKLLYYPQTVSVSMTEGNIATQDIELVKIPQYYVNVTVLDAQTLQPIENAQVELDHTYLEHTGVTDVNGEVSIGLYYEDHYDVVAGKWGYVSACFEDTMLTSTVTDLTIYLDQGIYDDFSFDFGWTVFGDAHKGMWEREVPVGVIVNGVIENPFTDGFWDCGNKAYITGNGSTQANDQEVDNGETILISPVFDLTGYTDPYINFNAFFYDMFGPADDTLTVSLYNGSETAPILKLYNGNTVMSEWLPYSISVSNVITATTTMQLILHISDYPSSISICEAGFDHFFVTDYSLVGLEDEKNSEISIYPNPVSNELIVKGIGSGIVEIRDLSGRLVQQLQTQNVLDVSALQQGAYILTFRDLSGEILHIEKVIKE
ncbi:MAG: choice-of-anchor B family protein [Crocinitomicaceae bacterium]|nr:choice-of-anchor B family protein [Crocinitomicaceae bacterium]